MHGYIVLTGS